MGINYAGFDMGGVIIKPSKMDEFYTQSEVSCTFDEFKRFFYDSDFSEKVYKGEITDYEFFNFIIELFQSTKTVEELLQLYYLSKGEVYSDTIDTINAFKSAGYYVFLISNLKAVDHRYLENAMDMSVFDRLFLSYKLGMCKPYEDIFKYIIDELGTNRIVFMDDSKRNTAIAQQFGITSILTTGKDIKDKTKSFVR